MAVGSARAQSPTGTISGVVTDPTGAALSEARVSIVNSATGQIRALTTSGEGHYSAAALAPSVYTVTVEAIGFKQIDRDAIVEAGTTTTVDLTLELGEMSESVTVAGTQPLVRHDHHQVGGVVTRDQIERLPLNGRNFLELAKLEPGVTNPARLADGRVFVSSLGGGLQTIPRIGSTRVTVDGASISTPGTVGVLLQVSQDVVQEFQIATVNFDLTSSLTSNGAINIVTRSGGNAYHGSGSYFHRDHHLAAYPGLSRDPKNADPSFERHQFGSSVGGPLRKNRAFFFGNFERTDQVGVVSTQPTDEFAALAGIFPSPYVGNQVNARVDVQLHRHHNAFARYTYDRNDTFANVGPPSLPSGWSHRVNQPDQGLAALTSVLSPGIVNDVRFSYFSSDTSLTPASSGDCPNCFGLGETRATVADVGLTFGSAGTVSTAGHRYQVTENLVWQQGHHSLRFGFDWEHGESTFSNVGARSGDITVFSPRRVRQEAPQVSLPASFTTVEDILQLPLRSFSMTVGPGTVLWEGFRDRKVVDLYRLYAGDTWRARPRLTLNYGLGWSYEPNALSHDLSKPALLAPILGADGLTPPAARTRNFSPTLGFAWTATRDGKTVLRGGAGRYFDPAGSTNAVNLNNERHLLSPLGTGNLTRTGANISHEGQALNFLLPTPFTGAQLLAILPGIRAELLQSINRDNRDFSVRNINRTKEGENLYDPSYATPYALHASLGLQREFAQSFVLSVDVAWKRFVHTYINGIDYNHWIPAQAGMPARAVIPPCAGEQRNDLLAVCSNGPMYFDTTVGRARYLGLLVRAERRFARGFQLLASYALGSFTGTNGTGTGTSEAPGGRVFGFNDDNWFENEGPLPTDQRHILNLSGFVELPWRLQLAASVSAYSPPPFAPYVSGVDFNGDGTLNDLLPGTTVNQFGREIGKDDLVRLVEAYNAQFGGKRTAGGQVAPFLALPDAYSFNDGFFTQDLRLTRTFGKGLRGARAAVFVEVFNLLNTPNLVGFGSNLRTPGSFGQPNARFSQVFGSGGPRAFQLGARLTF